MSKLSQFIADFGYCLSKLHELPHPRILSSSRKIFLSPIFIIFGLGVVSATICLLSNYLVERFSQSFYNDYSQLQHSLSSTHYSYSVMVTLGICIPVLVDYVMDILTLKQIRKQDFLERGIIIGSLLIPDVILLSYFIPYEKSNYFWPLAMAKLNLYLTAAFTHLRANGGKIFQTKLLLFLVCISFSTTTLQAFTSISTAPELSKAFIILLSVSALILSYFTYLWYLSVRTIRRELWTDNQISCTIYLCIIISILIIFAIFKFGFGYHFDNHSTSFLLICFRLVLVSAILITITAYGRTYRIHLVQTERALDRKRVFVRLVSHEIRTPLNIVVTGLVLIQRELQQRQVDPEMLDIISDTQFSCAMAVTLLDDLLSYEKLEAGILVLERTEVNAWTFLVESTKPFHLQARQKGVTLKFSNEEELSELISSISLSIDKPKMNQVMRNLISNAIKFTPEGGTITIHASLSSDRRNSNESLVSASEHERSGVIEGSDDPEDDVSEVEMRYLRIDVTDTGYGIAKENLPRLFKEIVQFNAGTLQNGGGSGLGLWLAKNIVQLHDGTVKVESEGEGTGCTFSVELPIIAQTLEITQVASVTPGGGRKLSVSKRMSGVDPLNLEQKAMGYRSRRMTVNLPSNNNNNDNYYNNISGKGASYLVTDEVEKDQDMDTNTDNVHQIRTDDFKSDVKPKGLSLQKELSQRAPMSLAHRMNFVSTKSDSFYRKNVSKNSFGLLDDNQDGEVMNDVKRRLSTGSSNGSRGNVVVPFDTKDEEINSVRSSETEEMNFQSGKQPQPIETIISLRCLMVDDAAMSRKMMKRAICTIFDVIDEAEDGQIAVTKIKYSMPRNSAPDVILIDHQMPNMDGPTAVQIIRELGYKGLIIGLTGNALPEDLKIFLDHGADLVLTKPMDMTIFENIIEDLRTKLCLLRSAQKKSTTVKYK